VKQNTAGASVGKLKEKLARRKPRENRGAIRSHRTSDKTANPKIEKFQKCGFGEKNSPCA
jgi:hypothetical protein